MPDLADQTTHPHDVRRCAMVEAMPVNATLKREEDLENTPKVDANPFVANAAVHGDAFHWHVDADPSEFVDSPWTQEHGRYFNRVGLDYL